MPNGGEIHDRQEACKTYIEQTKLLVALSSAFLLAPAAALPLIRGSNSIILTPSEWWLFVLSESAFVLSVLFGYLVLGTIAGSQHDGDYNVYRFATRASSILELVAYLVGLSLFAWLSLQLLTAPPGPTRPRISMQRVGGVGPFPSGIECYQIGEVPLGDVEKEIRSVGGDLVKIVLIGSADRQVLKPELRRFYGTNAGLAHARAECIKRVLLRGDTLHLDDDPHGTILTAARGPQFIQPAAMPEELEKDRVVEIYLMRIRRSHR